MNIGVVCKECGNGVWVKGKDGVCKRCVKKRLEVIRQKPHGEDVDWLIEQLEARL